MNAQRSYFKCHTCQSTVYSSLPSNSTAVEVVPCACCGRPVQFSNSEKPKHVGLPLSRRQWNLKFDGMQWGTATTIATQKTI